MNDILLPGAIADGDMSTRQFTAVMMSGTSGVAFEVHGISSGTQRPIGILQNDPNSSGLAAEVVLAGVCKWQLGGAVTQGDVLSNDSFGRAVALTVGSSGPNSTGRYLLGHALQSGLTTEVIYAYVHPPILIQGSS